MKKSKEEVFLEKLAKQEKKEIKAESRELQRLENEKLKESKATPPTEAELVLRYANRVIKNQQYHGRVDTEKFDNLEYKTNTKTLFLDVDFFFSVVFQSSRQKYEFMEKWEQMHSAVDSEFSKIQIVNGLKLATALGIDLKLETSREYPTGNLDLMSFVLDEETIS